MHEIKTAHFEKRCQQRRIEPGVLQLLDEFGDEQYTGKGVCVAYFSKSSRKKISKACGRKFFENIKPQLNVYRVESSKGELKHITAGYRIKRIRRT